MSTSRVRRNEVLSTTNRVKENSGYEIRCNGKWVQLEISIDAVNGMVLSMDKLPGEDAEQLKQHLHCTKRSAVQCRCAWL